MLFEEVATLFEEDMPQGFMFPNKGWDKNVIFWFSLKQNTDTAANAL